jgi:hypothetical protein
MKMRGMSRWIPGVIAIIAVIAGCGVCAADWLVLRGGKKIETAGQWTVQGNLLTIRQPAGGPKSVTLAVVDFDATLRANPRTARTADPGWHITPDGIKLLQEAARRQEAMSAQARAGQESGLEAGAVAGKPGKNGTGNAQGSGTPQASGRLGQDRGRGAGFDALERCKIWQDNVKLYNDCLAGN